MDVIYNIRKAAFILGLIGVVGFKVATPEAESIFIRIYIIIFIFSLAFCSTTQTECMTCTS